MGLWGLPSLPCRRSNYRYFRRVDGARYHSPYGSPARSVSRTSRRTRASIPGAISSVHGTLGLSPLRSRAPRPERLPLWIIHPVRVARLLFVFLASTHSWPRTEFGSARPPKRHSRALRVNRAPPARARFPHFRLNRPSIPRAVRDLYAGT